MLGDILDAAAGWAIPDCELGPIHSVLHAFRMHAQPIKLWLERSLFCTGAAAVSSGLAAINTTAIISSSHVLSAHADGPEQALQLACPAPGHAAIYASMLGASYRAILIPLLHPHQG